MKTIKVVCGIIWHENKIFIARRKPEKSLGGYWEFPGGKIEANETPQNALERELKEELGMIVTVGEYFCTNLHHYENFAVELIAYHTTFVSSTYSLTDHDAYEWKEPRELVEFKLAEADRPIYKKILE